ncbi:hypothetical protein O181_044333 [Austropuccinia psidii MF-1]|uniref:Uncharacterized protein n=1 Tax=Austropuccinia psidii MF-1 TaxID=1389203 RepID=A0A9Q3DN55_9BASI|nr:hypothetical protein [Austropuccinia psidii MF-1]
MVRQKNTETESTVTSLIPASTVNSEHNSNVIINQNNQPEPISSELINLDISNALKKANNLANREFFDVKLLFWTFLIIIMPSTRSGGSYNPSRNSREGYRCDCGRSKSFKEGNALVNGSQTSKLCHSEAYNTFLPSNRADTVTRSLNGHI